MPAERRFRAMGSDGHVVVLAPDQSRAGMLLRSALARIDELERRWSRFEPTSEVSRVNAASPHPVAVSTDTVLLASRALDAARETGGRFDATLLPALVRAGYDRTFSQLGAGSTGLAPDLPHLAAPARRDDHGPGRHGPGRALLVDPDAGTVAVGPGHGFDPGGLGKGLAADLVTAELMAAGATGALVSLGGDVRVRGQGPDDAGWPISVADPFDPTVELARLAIADGAVATSSRLLRCWNGPDGRPAHHLLDPATGRPSATDVVAVTVVAGDAWWAEALTKALFTLDAERGLGHVHHGAALIVDDTGRILASPPLQAVLR